MDIPLKFFIRKGNAVNYPFLNLLGKLDEPIEFTIHGKNQVRNKGKITDESGQPIPKAQVSLIWSMDNFAQYHGRRIFSSRMMELEILETDDQKNFSAHGLWPGEFNYLRVKARGLENWIPPNDWGKTNMETAECEETIDFGTTVLKKKGTAQGK